MTVHAFEQDLYSPLAAPKDLGALPGVGTFAIDTSGALVVFSPGGGSNAIGRWNGGTFEAVDSGCDVPYPEHIDVVGAVALVTQDLSPRSFSLEPLDSATCDSHFLYVPDAAIYSIDAQPARLSPDGKKVLFGAVPNSSSKTQADSNDFTVYDVASKTMTRVPFQPDCTQTGPFAWYPDNKRAILADVVPIEYDTRTGATRDIPSHAYDSNDPPTSTEVSPDSKTALIVGAFSIAILPLAP